ncbi:MAG TPA: DUF1338 domain-containing protein [Bacteroidales bacterium]|nr:DUF1338 domain-containing protein [Bacteroidales bacterium]HPI85498.1 DUF1338 domain-containing protein [Bacteroidales bacterium]HPM92385.1 DUF1338 domain-containing protein [Bacteroidales bacterium]
MNLEQTFNKLWEGYTSQNPAVQQVYDLFIREGERVVNDHIAFRTFNDPRVNIDVISKPFLSNGYVEKGTYRFEEKKLFAKHYEHKKDPEAPRVFISELLIQNFSLFLQESVLQALDQISLERIDADGLIFSGRIWEKPSFEIYSKLKEESEYAAWVYVFGFCANHFTVSVNYLQRHNTLEKVNSLLKSSGFLINDAGGEIKGTPEELLEQSSIKSGIVKVRFVEGDFEIPGCYYEFARRYPDENGKLYSGFIAKSADKIFESTNFYKK